MTIGADHKKHYVRRGWLRTVCGLSPHDRRVHLFASTPAETTCGRCLRGLVASNELPKEPR